MKTATPIALGLCLSLSLAGCTDASKQTNDQATADVKIDEAELNQAKIKIRQRIGESSIRSLSDISAGGTGDGLAITFPAAMLVNPSLALAAGAPITIQVPRTFVAQEQVTIERAASVSAVRATIINSEIDIEQVIGGGKTTTSGRLLAYVNGTTPTGESVGAVEVPQDHIHESKQEAAAAAGVNGFVTPVQIAAGLEAIDRFLSIPAR